MILVTGSNGFIGKAFCNYCVNNSTQTTQFDLPFDNILNINKLAEYRDGANYIKMIVHFAAIANLNESLQDQDKNFEVNIRGTYEVAKFCQKNDIPLIFISTCCVYGDGHEVDFEDSLPLTKEPYACSKMAGEYILRGIPDLKYCILRIGTVYGPGMRKELFNYIVFDKIMNDEIIRVNGNGNQTRTYIYIDDLVNGIYKACDKFHNGETINLCGNEQISVNHTMKIASELVGKSYMAEYGFMRYGDFQKENVSIEKAERLLGWQPKISYKEGMRRTYEWLKTC